MKDYYKIGEISKIYDIGRDSLMYYEKIGILKPSRDKNGYRMYNISDIWRLNLIKEFRSLDFPMKKVKNYLNDRNISSTKKIMFEELNLIDFKISELDKHKKNIIKRLNTIKNTMENLNLNEIKVERLNKRKAFLLNADIKRDEEFDFLIHKLQKNHESRFNIIGNNNIGAVFSNDLLNDISYNEFKSVICFLDDKDNEYYDIVFDEGYYVTLSYSGDYSNNIECMNIIKKFILKNNYKIVGKSLEIYKVDIHETGDKNEYITEIQVPILK